MISWRRAAPLAAAILLAGLHRQALAHIDWSRVNAPDPDSIGLYHFDSPGRLPGETQPAAGCPGGGFDLVIGPPVGTGIAIQADTREPIFAPGSLKFNSAQSAESAAGAVGTGGDLTIECWLKWDASMTSSSFELGLLDGPKLRLTRGQLTVASDQFGISTIHGDYRPAPGFTNWVAIGEEEAPLGVWIHFALAIHSTGITFDVGLDHDVYNPGSLARIFLNGHPVGDFPFTLDISGMRAHDESKVVLRNIAGPVSVDEFTLWRRDWSANGANSNPFGDGRGSGVQPCDTPNSVAGWEHYE